MIIVFYLYINGLYIHHKNHRFYLDQSIRDFLGEGIFFMEIEFYKRKVGKYIIEIAFHDQHSLLKKESFFLELEYQLT